ncbi:MAG: GNAT family N-acetyltransferase [Ktedonobacterales bacterium]
MNTHIPGDATGGVLLREVMADDLPIFFEQQLDPDATRMAAFASRDRDAFIAHWVRTSADETNIKQTILYNGQVAGNIVSYEEVGKREVGYWLGRNFWGKGIATQALSQFLRHVQSRPLYAHVAKHNIASLRVLQKCGFTITGEDTRSAGAGGDEIEEFMLKLEA